MSFTIRRFTLTDIDPLAHLIADVEQQEEGGSRPVAEIRAELETVGTEASQSGWLAQIDAGQIVGYNYVEMISQPGELNFWLRGVVHPAWRGQGMGRQLIQASWADIKRQADQPAWVNAWAYQHDQSRCHLLAGFGLRPDHIYCEMEIPAARVEQPVLLPPGVIIRPWDNRYCAAAAALRNQAFAHNWGYQPTTAEALHRRFQTARYEPTFSFTAWRQEQMLGLVHACLGWTRKWRRANEGEVVWLAVADKARGQGLGRALLLTAMHALREAGVENISLGTDGFADRPAIALYTQLGFTVRKAIVDYRGEI